MVKLKSALKKPFNKQRTVTGRITFDHNPGHTIEVDGVTGLPMKPVLEHLEPGLHLILVDITDWDTQEDSAADSR